MLVLSLWLLVLSDGVVFIVGWCCLMVLSLLLVGVVLSCGCWCCLMVLSLWLLVMSDGVVVVVGWCCLVVLSGGVVWTYLEVS